MTADIAEKQLAPLYSLADGTRAYTGTVGGIDPVAASDLATKNYVDTTGFVRTPLRNETGGILTKGTVVATSTFSIPNNRPTVVVADKDDPTKRPGAAVIEADVPNNTNFDGLVVGLLIGLNTSAFSVNDQLVLGSSGAVSRPPPDQDPFTGEIQLVGSVWRVDMSEGEIYFTLASGQLPMTAAHLFAAIETSPTGNVSGGEVTRISGLNVAVASGSGFVNDDTDVFRVPYDAVASLALAANNTNFIFVDKNGVVQASVSPPALGDNIILADAITDGSSVLLLANHQVVLTDRPSRVHEYVRDVVGNIVVSGVITAKDAISLRLEVDAGTFYTRDFRVTVPATDPITFTYWHRDGSGGFTRLTNQILIDPNNFDDGSGTLAALIAGEFKKDLLFVVFTTTGAVEYHVFYGQEKFTSQSAAESGNLPAADGDIIANGVQSSGIVIEGAVTDIASVVDARPFLGQLGPGTTAVTDHGLLSGLGDNDHAIYVIRSILTTKGDIFVRNASGVIRVAVGTDTQVLTADAAEASGIKWAAAGMAFPVFHFYADQFDNPVTADWAVNALAPAVADSNDSDFTIRSHDDTIEKGEGFPLRIPVGATNIKFTFFSRPEAAGGGNIVPRIYERQKVSGGSPTAWSAGVDLTALVFAANTNDEEDTETVTLASLGLAAGQLHKIQLTRNTGAGGDTLVGKWDLLELVVEFT